MGKSSTCKAEKILHFIQHDKYKISVYSVNLSAPCVKNSSPTLRQIPVPKPNLIRRCFAIFHQINQFNSIT